MIYCFSFFARPVGAIGITYHQVEEVRADNYEKALMQLYDKFEHLSNINYSEHKEMESTNDSKGDEQNGEEKD